MGALGIGLLIGAALGLLLALWGILAARNIRSETIADVFFIFLACLAAPLLMIAGGLLGLLGGFIRLHAGWSGLAFYLMGLLVMVVGLTLSNTRPWEQWRERQMQTRRERSRRFLDAAKRGDVAAVRSLLDQGVYVDTYFTHDFDYGRTALMYAVEAGHTDLVDLLLSRGARSSLMIEGQTARTIAQQSQRADMVRRLEQTS